MAKLTEGMRAPQFSLKDYRGHAHPGKAGKTKYYVVYFYPKDDTPGCTIEAQQFSEHLPSFKKRGVHVYGISGGSSQIKEKFCKKFDLSVPLLTDSDFSVAKKFGAFGKKSFMGRTYEGVLRKTFVLDDHFQVLKIFDSVKPQGHAEEVLSTIDELESTNAAHKPKHPNPLTRREMPQAKRTKAQLGSTRAAEDKRRMKGSRVTKKAQKSRINRGKTAPI